MWSYQKVVSDKHFNLGVLIGPNEFKLSVSLRCSVVFQTTPWGELLDVIVKCDDEDCSDDVSFLKVIRQNDLPAIAVHTSHSVRHPAYHKDIGMQFFLDYDSSFDVAVEEMRKHLE
jgi:hypothetical protein